MILVETFTSIYDSINVQTENLNHIVKNFSKVKNFIISYFSKIGEVTNCPTPQITGEI